MLIWKLINVTGTTSGHVGSICRFDRENAEIGKDYGVSNITVIQANHGIDTVDPKKLGKFVVHYGDGAYRDLGLKYAVKTRTPDGKIIANLYGNKTCYQFELLGEL